MKKFLLFALTAALAGSTFASWYWPFSSDDGKKEPRLSELMEPASILIDEASDLAADGKVNEAVEKYRAALDELDRIEIEYPDRVDKPEFSTLKTKRAYISAAIDSMLLSQARDNARAVAVSDTRDLEEKLRKERGQSMGEGVTDDPEKEERKVEELPEVREASEAEKRAVTRKEVRKLAAPKKAKNKGKKTAADVPMTKREIIMKAIAEKKFEVADRLIAESLNEKPNNAAALNLRAAKETAQEDFKAAEKTLDQAIQSNPRDPYAYYNMAVLYLIVHPENKSGARRYYETARAYGAQQDLELEAELQ